MGEAVSISVKVYKTNGEEVCNRSVNFVDRCILLDCLMDRDTEYTVSMGVVASFEQRKHRPSPSNTDKCFYLHGHLDSWRFDDVGDPHTASVCATASTDCKNQ